MKQAEKKVKKLLAKGTTNAKMAKTQEQILSYIMYLSPYKKNSFGKNVCGHASEGCIKVCLDESGMGVFSNVQAARKAKTDYFFSDMIGFLNQLYKELFLINAKAFKNNTAIAIRLNGTSDLDFIELIKLKIGKDILNEFQNLKFYDYTKNLKRAVKYLNTNYHLTFSRSESNEVEALTYLQLGGNVAAVFNKLPETYKGFKVINGDETDMRYMDQNNVIVGLTAKGKAKKDTSGFVIL